MTVERQAVENEGDQEREQAKEGSDQPAGSSAAVSSAPVSPATPANLDSVSRFVQLMTERQDLKGLRDELRALTNGIFIPEQHLQNIYDQYTAWITSETGKSDEHAFERIRSKLLHESGHPILWYVIEGKQCLLGYVLPLSPAGIPSRIPIFRGSPIDARSFLHFRDPKLQEKSQKQDEVQVLMDAQGFRLRIDSEGQGSFFCSQATLHEFLKLARNIPSVVKKHPELLQAARYALPALSQSVTRAKEVPTKSRLLIPNRFCKLNLRSFRLGDTIFLVNDKQEIVHFYGLRGKNLHNFLVQEYDAVKQKQQGRPIGEFQFPRKPGRSIAILRLGTDMYFLEPGAFREFVELSPMAPEYNASFKGRYTLHDCMREFAKSFVRSKRCEERELPRDCVPEKLRKLRFHNTESLVFVSNERRTLVAVLPKWKVKDVKKRRKGKTGNPSHSLNKIQA